MAGNNAAKSRKNKAEVQWTRPEEGWLKFSMNGASKDNPSTAGIRGILRDETGTTLA